MDAFSAAGDTVIFNGINYKIQDNKHYHELYTLKPVNNTYEKGLVTMTNGTYSIEDIFYLMYNDCDHPIEGDVFKVNEANGFIFNDSRIYYHDTYGLLFDMCNGSFEILEKYYDKNKNDYYCHVPLNGNKDDCIKVYFKTLVFYTMDEYEEDFDYDNGEHISAMYLYV